MYHVLYSKKNGPKLRRFFFFLKLTGDSYEIALKENCLGKSTYVLYGHVHNSPSRKCGTRVETIRSGTKVFENKMSKTCRIARNGKTRRATAERGGVTIKFTYELPKNVYFRIKREHAY